MTRLFIAGFPHQTTEEDLRVRFALYGELKDCFLIVDRETGVSRGFAFVEFRKAENADAAMKELDGADFLGRRLTVRLAKEKEKK